MKAIIHAGMPKTGSSSIQRTLFKLDMPDHLYAPWKGTSHNPLCSLLFLKNPEKHTSHSIDGVSKEELAEEKKLWAKRLVEVSRREDKAHLILSAEALKTKRMICGCSEFMLKHFSECRIIIYIRSPISFMQSAFQQNLKHGTVKKLDVSDLWPRYKDTVSTFDEKFGRENVDLYKFSSEQFPNGDVVEHFCQISGIEIKPDQILRTNDALSLEATSFLFLLQKKGEGGYSGFKEARQKMRVFLSEISKIGNQKVRFSPGLTRPVLEANAEELEWIEERLGQSLREKPGNEAMMIDSEADLIQIARQNIDALDEILERKMAKSGSLPHIGLPEDQMSLLKSPKRRQISVILAKLEALKALC